MSANPNETAREAMLRLGFTTDPRNPDRYHTGTLHPLHSLLPDVYLRKELGLSVRIHVSTISSDQEIIRVLEALTTALLPQGCGAERGKWTRSERSPDRCYLCDQFIPCPCNL